MSGCNEQIRRRVMTRALLILALIPSGLPAQDIGDKVKVRHDGVWVQGWIETLEPNGTFFIRDRFRDPGFGFQVSEVTEADWYKPKSLALDLLMGVAGAITLEAVLACSPEGGTWRLRCYSDNRSTQYAIQAGIGAAIGLFMHAIWPGRWTRWIEDGLVVR